MYMYMYMYAYMCMCVYICICICMRICGDDSALRRAARKDGEATRRAERGKHEKYPGPRLTPFAVETTGRIGAEARGWLLSQVRTQPEETQFLELARAYKVVSALCKPSVHYSSDAPLACTM